MSQTLGRTGISGVWTTYILRDFVPMLTEAYLFADHAEPATLPRGAGGYVARWNLPATFNGSTTALTEASATAGELAYTTITNVEATIAEYGQWMRISDLAGDTYITGTLDAFRQQFVDAGSDAIDNLIYAAAKGSTNFLHAGDTTTAGVTLTSSDTLTAQDFPVIAGFFHGTNAKGYNHLQGDYAFFIHPDQEVDLITDVTTNRLSWTDVNKHVPEGFDQLIRVHRFVGRISGVTAMRTTQIVTISEDVTAYHSIAMARWGVGWLGLGEKGPKAPDIIMKRPGPSDTSQPLNMYMTIGWKVKAVSRLLDSNRVLVVYSAV